MKTAINATLLLAFATPTLADLPMTGAQFERYTMGRTYTYGHPGVPPYGIELYRPNRQVTWAIYSDECVDGYWYDTEDSQICFVYPNDIAHKCWFFYKEGDRLRADFVADIDDLEYEVFQTGDSIPCLGPMVGA